MTDHYMTTTLTIMLKHLHLFVGIGIYYKEQSGEVHSLPGNDSGHYLCDIYGAMKPFAVV